jgi:hypothetical protein
MGYYKQRDIEAQEANAHVHPALLDAVNAIRSALPTRPKVHVLLCDGMVVDVYTDSGLAEYEMRLCQQADKYYGDNAHTYDLISKPVNTNAL